MGVNQASRNFVLLLPLYATTACALPIRKMNVILHVARYIYSYSGLSPTKDY